MPLSSSQDDIFGDGTEWNDSFYLDEQGMADIKAPEHYINNDLGLRLVVVVGHEQQAIHLVVDIENTHDWP